jgi:hypothetical protein
MQVVLGCHTALCSRVAQMRQVGVCPAGSQTWNCCG